MREQILFMGYFWRRWRFCIRPREWKKNNICSQKKLLKRCIHPSSFHFPSSLHKQKTLKYFMEEKHYFLFVVHDLPLLFLFFFFSFFINSNICRATRKWYLMFVSGCMTLNHFPRICSQRWNDYGKIPAFRNASPEATNIS